jgi:hypothetical protein
MASTFCFYDGYASLYISDCSLTLKGEGRIFLDNGPLRWYLSVVLFFSVQKVGELSAEKSQEG